MKQHRVSWTGALVNAMTAAPCDAWLDFIGADDVGACLPSPDRVVTAATQTR